MKKYTKEQILLAAQISEASITETDKIVSNLDEAVKIEQIRKVVQRIKNNPNENSEII